MSTQPGRTMEMTRNGLSRQANEDVKNGFQNSGRNSTGLEDNSLKSPLRKTRSSASLNLNIGSNVQGCETKSATTKLKRDAKENGVIERANGRATVEQAGSDSQFRERLPSFTIRRSSPAILQTHFAVYKFVPRHKDELAMNVGDAIHVEKVHDDLWYEGTNLKSGDQGIFPGRFVSDVLSNTGLSFGKLGNGKAITGICDWCNNSLTWCCRARYFKVRRKYKVVITKVTSPHVKPTHYKMVHKTEQFTLYMHRTVKKIPFNTASSSLLEIVTASKIVQVRI